MVTGLFGAGLALALTLLVAIYRKLDGVPLRTWSVVKDRRSADEARALTVLQEAAALKVGPIVKAIRDHEEQIAASFHAQLAEADVRARLIERRLTDTATVLGAASTLVRELRALVDELAAPSTARAAGPAERPAEASGADGAERRTRHLPRAGVGGLPRAAAEGDEPGEDELTMVGPKGGAAASGAGGRR